MKSWLLLILLATPSVFGASTKAVGVQCELEVFQADTAHAGQRSILYRDTAEFVKGIRAEGFLSGFSTEIEFEVIDTGAVSFTVHIVTLGPKIHNYSKRFQTPYLLPARMEPLTGKAGEVYTLSIRPLKRTMIDTAGCGYIHYQKEDFTFDPSTYSDFYFVKRTHGDYFWSSARSLMEDRYETFSKMNAFNLPGKYITYLCPCAIPSIIWDKRFYVMVDPTRNSVFTIYTTEFDSADPVALLLASIYRNYGYAPPFLAEGMAGYLSLPTIDMRELVKQKKTLPLDSLLGTFYYMKANPRTADQTAASFVKYLLDQYQIDKFLSVYRKADDLTLRAVMTGTYGKSVADLEREWLHYLDTVTVRPIELRASAAQAETMFNYRAMLNYRREELKLTSRLSDSLYVLSELGRAAFFNGDYEDAVKWQQQMTALDTPRGTEQMTLGSYRLMLGQYDSAGINMDQAQQLDTVSPIVRFNVAYTDLVRGNKQKAQDVLTDMVEHSSEGPAAAESRIVLANLLRKSKLSTDKLRIGDYYHDAIKALAQSTSGSFINPTSLMWTGIAYLGLGDTGTAQDYLNTALFLESRPFYQGMIYLWLGKVADARKERDVAEKYYRKVLDLPSAQYHKDEARELLLHPYN